MSLHAATKIHIKQYKTYTATCWLRIIDLLCSDSQLYFLLFFSPSTCAVFASFPSASNFTIINCTSIMLNTWKGKKGVGGRHQNSQDLTKLHSRKIMRTVLGSYYILPCGSCGFFKSSSLNKLSSSIRSKSSSIWTLGKVLVVFFMANEEPIFHEGFLALTYEKRRKHLSTTNINLPIKFTSPHPIQTENNKPLNQGDGMRSIHSFIFII